MRPADTEMASGEAEPDEQDVERAAYIVAGYVGIPSAAMTRWLKAMEMCGFEIVRKDLPC